MAYLDIIYEINGNVDLQKPKGLLYIDKKK